MSYYEDGLNPSEFIAYDLSPVKLDINSSGNFILTDDVENNSPEFNIPADKLYAYGYSIVGEFNRNPEILKDDLNFQLKSKDTPNEQLESKIKDWFSKVGIQYNPVEKIYRVDGTETDAVAKANVLTGILEVVEGKSGINTLPEEAGHFIVELLGDEHPLVKGMMKNIVN